LSERLRARIEKEGPISFRDFMTAALYDPQEGYYARGARIGERGDFVTSPHVSPAFAAAIARRFADDADKIEGPVDFVEVGAGEGEFLEGFARALARDAASLARRVRLTAIERSPASRQALLARKILPHTRLLETVEELPERSVKGWIFSNELYDALPVVRVVGAERGLEELRVGVDSDRFIWTRAPARRRISSIGEFPYRSKPAIGKISFAAAPSIGDWRGPWRRAMVTFDYGLRRRFFTIRRRAGRHARGALCRLPARRPLSRPGKLDLTAHVNWDDLVRSGESKGSPLSPSPGRDATSRKPACSISSRMTRRSGARIAWSIRKEWGMSSRC
jgi:SAM-dependent MidA family methyltransferase